jgi:hypothetical protein
MNLAMPAHPQSIKRRGAIVALSAVVLCGAAAHGRLRQ